MRPIKIRLDVTIGVGTVFGCSATGRRVFLEAAFCQIDSTAEGVGGGGGASALFVFLWGSVLSLVLGAFRVCPRGRPTVLGNT